MELNSRQLYQLYTIDWCKDRGYDWYDFKTSCYADESRYNECFVSYDEFLDWEYEDKSYMYYLEDHQRELLRWADCELVEGRKVCGTGNSRRKRKMKEAYWEDGESSEYVQYGVEDSDNGIVKYFDNKEQAIRYAEDNGYDSVVEIIYWEDGDNELTVIWEKGRNRMENRNRKFSTNGRKRKVKEAINYNDYWFTYECGDDYENQFDNLKDAKKYCRKNGIKKIYKVKHYGDENGEYSGYNEVDKIFNVEDYETQMNKHLASFMSDFDSVAYESKINGRKRKVKEAYWEDERNPKKAFKTVVKYKLFKDDPRYVGKKENGYYVFEDTYYIDSNYSRDEVAGYIVGDALLVCGGGYNTKNIKEAIVKINGKVMYKLDNELGIEEIYYN